MLNNQKTGLGQNIIKTRKQQHMQQKTLAELLNVDGSTVTKWEKGTREPSLEMLVNICSILNVSSDYLLGANDQQDTNLCELISLYNQLNDTGKAILIEQAEFYASSDKYQKTLNENAKDKIG